MLNDNLVEIEDQMDLQFVVNDEYYDGEEFVPAIVTNGDEAEIQSPEEVAQDFSDEENANNFAALPVNDDERGQTLKTFNYADGERPDILQGVPSDLPEREASLGSAVVSLNSKNRRQSRDKTEVLRGKVLDNGLNLHPANAGGGANQRYRNPTHRDT